MKTKFFTLLLLIGSTTIFAQPWQTTIGNAVPPGAFLGTTNNQPLNFRTNNVQRAHINGNRVETIGGYTINANGFMGLGENSVAPAHPNGVWNDFGPFSLLHLNGSGTEVRPSGFRPWMQTGITLTDNHDLSYFGLRKVDTGLEKTETVIAWSDNPLSPSGPDDMVFRFFYPGNGNTNISSSLDNPGDIDGRHIARFTGKGEMGLGATFGDPAVLATYVRPASLLHMSVIEHHEAFLQITQQMGTGETVYDGLRLGIMSGTTINSSEPPCFLRWQEITPFIIQTDWNTSSGGLSTGNGERLRISSINAPGVPHPVGIQNNTTRVSISHSGNNEVSEPRSLLHMGYNTSPSGDGWRNWMDVGMFLNNGSDNMYVGLKKQKSGINDRYDAVVNWGDNQIASPGIGPDNLRFIFTSTIGNDNPPANSNDGLEIARMEPSVATTLAAPNFGMMGIGDFSPSGPNTAVTNVVNAKLDIDGDLRIRTVSERDDLTRVLVIDPDDHNRVHWRSMASLGGNVTANNGLSINPANNVQLGQTYSGTPAYSGVAELLNDREVPLKDNNILFSMANDKEKNMVVISSNGINENAALIVEDNLHRNAAHIIKDFNGIPQTGDNFALESYIRDYTSSTGAYFFGIKGQANGSNPLTPIRAGGLYGNAVGNYENYGVFVKQTNNNVYGNQGGRFEVIGNGNNFQRGVEGRAMGVSNENTGGKFIANNGTVNYGVWASAPSIGSNRAGYFVGLAESTVTGILSSDKMFKINVANIEKATDVLRKLKPHTYNMDVTHYPQFNFEDRLQYGFIAQEVAEVLPALVHDSYMPSELDSLGNEISPAVSYKSLNYNAFIPITVQAVNEISEKLDKATLSDQTVKTNVQSLTNSLDKVKQMRGVTYEWSNAAQNNMSLDSLPHIGFIAQEIAAIEPLLTFVDDSSLVHVNYDRVAPLLVESVKELDVKILAKDSLINHLQDEINTIKECLRSANICYGEGNRTMNNEGNNNENSKSIELVNTNSIILDQNLPNPFAESTVINYNIPAEVIEAKLLFYDLNGRIIKELIIDERGESKLTVYGTNLKTGVYTYSLIADGELIATKKMVKK